MMQRCSPFPLCRALAAVLLGFAAAAAATAPAAAQFDFPPSPYIFFIFDTSGSMSYSPRCTQDQFDEGYCNFLCPTGDCFVPMQGDDPASKFFQLKEALFDSIAYRPEDDLLLGFASLNQDTLYVSSKHWLYQATNDGPPIPGGPNFPAAGTQEVFGRTWTCDTGSGNHETGCYATTPAHVSVPWEVTRMQMLPKGGLQFNQTITFYLRTSGTNTYKIRYTPTGSAGLGSEFITTNVTLLTCLNPACTATAFPGETRSITWQLVSDFVSWDNGDTPALTQTNPLLTYFPAGYAVDAWATNTCSGWDPNNDGLADRYPSRYSLFSMRWPTDNSDPRGDHFSVGDVIPLDWRNSHRIDLEQRLAPNLVSSGVDPDFRTAIYLNDSRLGTDTFLRLKKEVVRPLIPVGSTPLEASLASFQAWYTGHSPCSGCLPSPGGWSAVAALQDPSWADRHVSVVMLTDGDDTCDGNPCNRARDLYSHYGVRTFIVAFGAQPVAGGAMECAAAAGGTGAPYYPQTEGELTETLNQIYEAAANP